MGTDSARPKRIVVAGASGFVGRSLVAALKDDFEVVGLTRSPHLPEGSAPGERGLRWVTADLFSLLELEAALVGADSAVYLVHSMLASAELTQGTFVDFDLILADNFARAARHCGVKHIVYLGGLVPPERPLSPHLLSRLEVERTLSAHGVPVTALRASIVIGPEGSSFRIVENLVRRLPLMVIPRWGRMPTQPIDQSDLVPLLRWCLEHPEACAGRVAEVGGPEVVSYRDLLVRTARALGLVRRILDVSVVSPRLSKLWVSLISGVPLALVSPLIDSLAHPMVVHDDWLQRAAGLHPLALDESLRRAVNEHPPRSFSLPRPRLPSRRDVRSVQRLPLPQGWRAEDVVREYMRWLPRLLSPWLRIEQDPEGTFRLGLRGVRPPLLMLSPSRARSTPDRPLLYISGGLLARLGGPGRGRLEFREIPGRRFVLASIHSFAPSLPWQLYKYSQARLHLWVMNAFARHLSRLKRAERRPVPSAYAPPA